MHDAIELAQRLVAIDSINPSLVQGAAGESAIAAFCASWLGERGFEVETLESTPGRPSLVARRRGAGGGRTLMLNGHLDTVNASPAQLVPAIRDGRLYGRGAFDMKSAVAALMVAADRCTDLRGDLVLTLVADEEFGSLGTTEVLASLAAGEHIDACIVAEPSELELTLAHRGFAWFEVEVTGLAAHGSMPEQGIDAIARATRLMQALDELRARLEAEPRHPSLGYGTVRVATINGGVDAATVAPACILTIERRYLPGESPASVEAQLRSTIAAVEGAATTTVRQLVSRAAFEAAPDWPIVQAVTAAYRDVVGAEPATRGEPFWTDAALVLEAGIPCVVIGVDGGGAHADEEWATLDSIEKLTGIVEAAARRFCG